MTMNLFMTTPFICVWTGSLNCCPRIGRSPISFLPSVAALDRRHNRAAAVVARAFFTCSSRRAARRAERSNATELPYWLKHFKKCWKALWTNKWSFNNTLLCYRATLKSPPHNFIHCFEACPFWRMFSPPLFLPLGKNHAAVKRGCGCDISLLNKRRAQSW